MRSVLATLAMAAACVYSAPVEVAGFEAANLSHIQPRRRWSSPNLTQAEVNVDLRPGLAATRDTGISSYGWVFTLYSTAGPTATHELWLGSSLSAVQATGTSSWYSGALPVWRSDDNDRARFPRRHNWFDLGGQRTEPWMRYKITDPTNPAGFVELGLLVPHPGYVPTLPVQAWPQAGVVQELRETQAVTGPRHAQERPIERQLGIKLHANGAAAAAEMEDDWLGLQQTVGVAKTVVLLVDANATERVMQKIAYGNLESLEKVDLMNSWGYGQLELSVRERL